MKAEKAIIAIMRANAAVTDLVGSGIYPVLIPENAVYPCITVERISGQRIVAPLFAVADPGAVDVRLQVTAWGRTYESVKTVSEAVRVAVERYRGDIVEVTVWDIVPETDGPDLYDGDLQLYGAPADYTLSHPE
ncbi:MAG: hypothetical protein JWM78_1667 [Verrucomicrobiaceae bacterium]|nr:hypothetical protein [Verrucomicrobiaceae bacterium]